MSNPVKTTIAYIWDTLSFGPVRRSTAGAVTASANRLSGLFRQIRDTIEQRHAVSRHETFQQAVERLKIDKAQIEHVHQAMTVRQRGAILAFGVVSIALSIWLAVIYAKPTLGNLISLIVTFELQVICYMYCIKYGLRRYQIEYNKLCSLREYLRDVGYIHPLLW